ncbi:MAG: hypothetical protein ACQEQP_08730, partial [Bacillota bacterium]
MNKGSDTDSGFSFKINSIKNIKKLGQVFSVILYLILVILLIGFNNAHLYLTRMNLSILSELIFIAVPFLILFYAYRKLKFLYYTYLFSIGYFLLSFSIVKDVNSEQLSQLGYSNIDTAIAIIAWILLFILMNLPGKY